MTRASTRSLKRSAPRSMPTTSVARVWRRGGISGCVAGLLRRPGLGARHRLARRRLAEYSAVSDLELHEAPPDHSTLSRTRRLIDVETHQAVFTWVLHRLADADLVHGRTMGIDATTLEANAAMRSIVRRDTGEAYEAWLTRLAAASGIATPTRAELARFDAETEEERVQRRLDPVRTIRTRRSRR